MEYIKPQYALVGLFQGSNGVYYLKPEAKLSNTQHKKARAYLRVLESDVADFVAQGNEMCENNKGAGLASIIALLFKPEKEQPEPPKKAA